MTQYFPFSPNILTPFQFSPTLDGALYSVYVPWCLFGKRYYVSIFNPGGTLLVSLPMAGSNPAVPIQGMDWANGQMTITVDETVSNRLYPPGTTIDLVFKGCQPTGYGGKRRCLIINKLQLTFPTPYLGMPVIFGQLSHDVNLVGGYLKRSALIFRDSSQTFEADP